MAGSIARRFGESTRVVTVTLAAVLAGCADEGASGDADTDSGSGATREPERVCDTDYSDLDPAPVSFRADVMPIFSASCISSTCHADEAPGPAADLYLGPRCRFTPGGDPCSYDAPTNPDFNPLYELSDESVAATLADLLDSSATAPAVRRVVPGDPAESFLLHKLAGTQDDQGHECSSLSASASGCGAAMPSGGSPLCLHEGDPSGQRRFDIVARWIAQGAGDG